MITQTKIEVVFSSRKEWLQFLSAGLSAVKGQPTTVEEWNVVGDGTYTLTISNPTITPQQEQP